MDTNRLIDKYLPGDYSDSIEGKTTHKTDADTLFHFMFEDFPGPVRFLFKLRTAIAKPLGLKRGISFRDHIIERNADEIIVGMDDKHLGFWVSVYVSDSNDSEVCTVVQFHNTLGRLYFAGIWCFHKLIVAGMFRRALRTIDSAKPETAS